MSPFTTYPSKTQCQLQFQGNAKKSAFNFSKFGVPRPSKSGRVLIIHDSTTTQTYDLTCGLWVPTNSTKENK